MSLMIGVEFLNHETNLHETNWLLQPDCPCYCLLMRGGNVHHLHSSDGHSLGMVCSRHVMLRIYQLAVSSSSSKQAPLDSSLACFRHQAVHKAAAARPLTGCNPAQPTALDRQCHDGHH